jgi:hypothetical protein
MKDPLESVMLDQLLALNDCRFRSGRLSDLAERDADRAGEQNYVALLRSGHDKVRLLGDMARSEEAVRMGTTIAGLNAALVRRKIGRIPIFGPAALKSVRGLAAPPIPILRRRCCSNCSARSARRWKSSSSCKQPSRRCSTSR